MQHSWTKIDGLFITSMSRAGCLLKGMGKTLTFKPNIPMIHIMWFVW